MTAKNIREGREEKPTLLAAFAAQKTLAQDDKAGVIAAATKACWNAGETPALPFDFVC
jgi:hypothetical protein